MTSKELIDAIKGCDKVIFKLTGVGEREYDTSELIYIVEALRFQQELVRCKDCNYKVDREFGRVICMRHSIETHKCGYCHNGERRDEE